MSPLGRELMREVPALRADQPLGEALSALVESGLPALPVCDDGRLVGMFGERSAISAVLPGYVGELSSAAFVSAALEDALENRLECVSEPVSKHMVTEHVEVQSNFSSAQLAETFLHHRVAVIPVVDGKRLIGAVTRRDFVRSLTERVVPQ